jgi:hypothetical protein
MRSIVHIEVKGNIAEALPAQKEYENNKDQSLKFTLFLNISSIVSGELHMHPGTL